MLVPGGTDFPFVALDQCFGRAKLPIVQAVILRQFDSWLKPELDFSVRAICVNVHSRFFAREEKEPEAAFTKDCGAQGSLIPKADI
jgi:hypothetical protein